MSDLSHRRPIHLGSAPVLRLLTGLAIWAVVSGCGSSTGCEGCTPQPIPGGFPAQHRVDNAMQVRVSSSGIAFMEKNFSTLVEMLVPGGLSFTIPPTDCNSSSQKLCCSGPACTATATVSSVDITPTPQSTARLNLRATVKTSPIKFERKLLFYWLDCNVTFDSAKSSPSTLGLKADMNLIVNANNQNKLEIMRGSTILEDFSCGDVTISGGIDCTIAGWLCTFFQGMIKDQLVSTLDSTLDGMLKSLPMGQEGRFDVASFLAAYSPRTSGLVDYLLWAGGYAAAESEGFSVGVLGGFRPAQYSSCVPNCEKAGATCTPPPLSAIPRSTVFRGNTRPDGKPFDVGIGVDTRTLDLGAYAMYASGGLCLDVSTHSVAQLSSATFSLLVPSINTLTASEVVPMMISVRPRQPPTVTLGKGTYHKDAGGKIVIDDPLLKITAKDFAIDIYIQLDERMVRLFTVVGKLEVPALLYADATGKLQPMLGSLDKALTEVRVENSELITEDPAALAQSLPTILSLAAGFLASGFAPIELPSVQKLKLVLDGGSITTTDASRVLAIFANLGIVSTTGFGQGVQGEPEGGRVEATARQEELRVPPTAAFRLGASFDPEQAPRLTLRVGARRPASLEGQPLEWAYRVDAGFYQPWVSGEQLVIQDPLFWLQGEHTVEVMARVKDRPETTGLQPARVRVLIDTVPPEVKLTRLPGAVRAEVWDLGAGPDRVELSWSVGGGAFSAFGRQRQVQVPEGASVEVRARDAAGNLSSARAQAVTVAPLTAAPDPDEDQAGGCSIAGAATPAFLWPGLVGAALFFWRRRRRR